MPAPNRYDIEQVDVGNYYDAFRRGRADRMAAEDEARNRSLSQYLPGALEGDKEARKSALAAGNPDQMIALSQAFAGADRAKLEAARERNGRLASLLNAVQTKQLPLDRAKQIAIADLGIDPERVAAVTEADIPGFIAQTQTVTDQLNQVWKQKEYDLDVSRTKAQNAASYAAADASRASAAKDRVATTPQIGPDGKPLPPPPGDKQIDNEAKIRAEFIKGADEFVKVRDAYGRIQASAKDPSAAGDLALIFSYMKILDPGSVVREQEFANAQNAAGVPDQVRNMYNKVLSGERLAPNQRADFTGRAGKLYKQQLQSFRGTEKLYQNISKGYGFDTSRTVPDLSLGVTGDEMSAPARTPIIKTQAEFDALPSGTLYVEPDGKRYRKP